MTAVEAQEYLPHLKTDDSLVYVAVHGYGWDRGPAGPAKQRRDRHPVALVTWDPVAERVKAVTGFAYPFSVEYHELVMVIEQPEDLDHLVDLLRPYVDSRDERVYLA